jgi:hypothetical protein
MEEKKEQEKIDPNLDIPAEANRGKHINFLDIEMDNDEKKKTEDDFSKERHKQWEEGIAEGKKDRNDKQSRD